MKPQTSATIPQKPESRFHKTVSWVLRYCLPWAITVGLLIWFFQKVNLHDVMQIIRRGCNFWWIASMMLATTLGLVIRGVRWDMQLRQAGAPPMPIMEDSCAIFGAYALNLVFPRLGEAWRCLFVSRRQKVPFMTVVGTDIGDRTADAICVVVTIIMALTLCSGQMKLFFSHYAIGRSLNDVFSSPWLWIVLAVLIGGFWLILHFWKDKKWVQKLSQQLHHVWYGFVALFKVKPLGLYLWLTLGIWLCYFLETYLCFFAFPFTDVLVKTPGTAWGLAPGLICLVFGSCSTIIPSNGGLGPWTIATAYALELYGIAPTDAAAYALVVWGMQSVMLIALGIFTAFYTRERAGQK